MRVTVILYIITWTKLCIAANTPCEHPSCNPPPSNPPVKHGRIVQISGDSHYIPRPNMDEVKEILRRGGIEGEDAMKEAGADAFGFISDKFGIDLSFVNDSLLLGEESEMTSLDGKWKADIGSMGPGAQMQVLSETIRTTDGKVFCRVPAEPVIIAFAFWRVVCEAETCPIKDGKVLPQSTRITRNVVATMEGDWNIFWRETGAELFYQYSESPGAISGIVVSEVFTPVYGDGEINGVVHINAMNRNDAGMPSMKVMYLVTYPKLLKNSDLPDWTSSSTMLKTQPGSIVFVVLLILYQWH